jgi:hypothetical protein
MWCDHFGHGRSVASRLDDDVIVMRQRLRERVQMGTRHANSPEPHDVRAIQHHRLGKDAVNVQSHDPHRACLLSAPVSNRGSGRATRQLRIRARSASGRAAGAAR